MRRRCGSAPGMCPCRTARCSRLRRSRRSRTWWRRRGRLSARNAESVATAVTMPVLGLTMEEGTVAEWLKREGDTVQQDEPLLTVEMDKGTVEVPSPAGGVLRRIVVQTGTTVPVRTLIAEIGEPGEVATPTPDRVAAPVSSRVVASP